MIKRLAEALILLLALGGSAEAAGITSDRTRWLRALPAGPAGGRLFCTCITA